MSVGLAGILRYWPVVEPFAGNSVVDHCARDLLLSAILSLDEECVVLCVFWNVPYSMPQEGWGWGPGP